MTGGDAAGDRAYVYNEASYSITAIDMNDDSVIAKNIPTAFVLHIDGTTVPVDSDADTFRDLLGP